MSDLAPPFGVLLVNLGTPDSPTAPDVRKFLKQFLSDPRVVDLSPWLWKPILNGIILNTRPAKVAKLYQSIWWDEGSPLMVISQKQRDKLKMLLKETLGQSIPVELGMSYGNPSLQTGLDNLTSQGVDKVFVLPLYAQYSCSTVAPVYDALAELLKAERNIPEMRMNKQYFDHPAYIQALAQSVKNHWQAKGQAEVLLMSFHGVPLRYVTEGDPYQQQCQRTAELLAEQLELTAEQWRVCFQSQFGKEQWISPATDQLLEDLPKQGIKSVDIMCPAFSCDCLETLEEIAEEGKEAFLSAGGERYEFIACLNDSEQHIQLLAQIVQKQTQGWH
ncbi:ferrochelatase [Shewanella sp. 125m-1]